MSVAFNTASGLAGRLVATGLALGSSLLIARALGPAGNGAYTLLLLVHMLVLTFANAGISVANTVLLANGTYPAKRLAGNAVLLAALFGAAAGLVAVPVIAAVKDLVFEPLAWRQLLVVLALAPASLLVQYLGGVVLGLNRVTTLSALGVAAPLTLFAAVSTMAAWGRLTIETAVAAWAGSALVGLAAHASIVGRVVPLRPRIDREVAVATLRFGVRAYLTNIIGTLNLRVDVLLVSAIVGAAAVGQYTVAVLVTELVWYIPTAMATALYPRLAAAYREDAQALARRAARHAVFLSGSVALLLATTAPLVVPLVLGEAFRPSVALVWLLLPGVWIFSLASIWSAYFTSHLGRPGVSLAIAGTSVGANVMLNLALLPALGVQGAAVAASLSYAAATLFGAWRYVYPERLLRIDAFMLDRQDLIDYMGTVRRLREVVAPGGRRL